MAKKKKTDITTMSIDQLTEELGGREIAGFFIAWLSEGRNATKAYLKLHPEVTEKSAGVLGSRMLGKVRRDVVMQSYGLDINAYMTQLNEGLNATKLADDGEGVVELPDHKVRRDYHKTLGQLLGIEGGDAGVQVQVNVQKATDSWLSDAYEDAEVVDAES